MSPIEFNNNHWDKLNEMCQTLFPNQQLVKYDCCFDDLTDGLIRFGIGDEIRDNLNYQSQTFHWFEFCTKIGYKIFSKKENWYNSEEFKTFMRIMCMQDKTKLSHPIDYLYGQFKQLK